MCILVKIFYNHTWIFLYNLDLFSDQCLGTIHGCKQGQHGNRTLVIDSPLMTTSSSALVAGRLVEVVGSGKGGISQRVVRDVMTSLLAGRPNGVLESTILVSSIKQEVKERQI